MTDHSTVYKAAQTIWTTSHADEGTISATGADIVAQALADAGLLADPLVDAAANDHYNAAVKCSEEALTMAAKLRAAENRIDELREQVGIEVRSRDEWEANAERAMIERDEAQAERNEAQAEQDRLADIIKGLYETIDDERSTIRKLLAERGHLCAERDEARATLDRVRAAADTLTWRNDYGDAQQIIYAAIDGEDQS